ncbi:hypothetical protein [Amycolatopsis samaneae]|uniref:Uncharacterized protein n=1 Tax=Amycolatopsis samaneae TaxID=664691 RepID=A0ABW5GXR9_9PSEU
MTAVWLSLLAETVVVTGIAAALARMARRWRGARREPRGPGSCEGG